MEEMTFVGKLKRLKQDLKPMTFRQKVDHIWTYYKSMVIVLVLIVMGFSLVVTAATNKSTKILISGVSVNVELSEDAKTYLREGYYEKIGTGSSMEKVNFYDVLLENLATTNDYEANYYTLMSLIALGSAKELDYLLVDETALKMFIQEEMLLDLTDIYTQEKLDGMGKLVIYARNGDTNVSTPIAFDVTQTEFIKKNTNTSGPIYLAFMISTDREETCADLYEYILAWKPEI